MSTRTESYVRCLILALCTAGYVTCASAFVVFDAIQLPGKPDLRPYGLPPISMLYGSVFWDSEDRTDLPDAAHLDKAGNYGAKLAMFAGNDYVVIDIEHWDIHGDNDAEVKRNVDKYIDTIEGVRETAPNLQLGYYGNVPIRDYWSAIRSPDSYEYQKWQQKNDKLQSLADAADVIYPSVYAFYNKPERWEAYAIAMINEARRLAPGKPVIAFLMPRYHNSTDVEGRPFVDRAYWRLQLDTAHKHADAIVIWTGHNPVWDNDAEWWDETILFMAENDMLPESIPAPTPSHDNESPANNADDTSQSSAPTPSSNPSPASEPQASPSTPSIPTAASATSESAETASDDVNFGGSGSMNTGGGGGGGQSMGRP